MSNAMKTAPILVAGLGRSGSTLVAELINSHPTIYLSDESWLFYRSAIQVDNLSERHRIGLDRAHHVEAHRRMLTHLYTTAAKQHKAQRFGEKCPPATRVLQSIDEILGGETKIVWTMRHPIDVGLSWIERFCTPERLQKELSFYGPVKAHGPSPIQMLSAVMSVYKRVALRVHTALQKMPNRVHIFHYENMVEHPKEAARSLFKFLEEPFAESLVDDLFKTRRQIIGGDPKFNQTQKIHTNSKGRWWSFATEHSADFTTVVCDCKVRECMQFLGYESELQELQPFLGG